MTIFKRGEIYSYAFSYRGVRYRESSKSRDKDVCRRLEAEHRRQLELNHRGLVEVAKPKKFTAAAKEYIESREAHWAPKTQGIHLNSLAHLEPFFAKQVLTAITADHISRYQRMRKQENASGRTINIEVSLVRLVLRKHKLWNTIADDVKMLKENKDIGRELSDDETERLLAAAKKSASRSLYPAILISMHTGLRNEELRLLRWHQIDLIEGDLTVGKSKTEGGKGRVVPLSRTAWAAFKEWRAQFPEALPEHAVFPRESYGLIGKKGTFGGKVAPYETFPMEPIGSWKSAWQRAKKVAGVKCRWHDAGRHTFVSRVAAGGATDGTIQAIAGWMSPKMIERYSHVRNKAKRDAVAVLDTVARVH